MRAVLALVAVFAVLGASSSSSSTGSSFVPGCPQPLYTADGNLEPLFCRIDNPAALAFYRPLAPHLFALGRDASPAAAEHAAELDYRHATVPELCAAYALWSYRWHWRFGVNAVMLGVPGARC